MNLYLRLLKMAKPHVGKFLLALLCMGGFSAATAAMAYLVKPIIDDIFVDRNMSMLTLVAVAILVVAFLKGLCSYGQLVLMNYIGQRIVTDLRNELYNHIQRHSLSFFYRNPTGMLMSRITNDVNLIQQTVSDAVTSLMKDSLLIVALTCVILYMNWKLALVAFFVFPLALYPIVVFGRKMRKVSTDSQVTMGTLSSLLQETISGTRIVKAFGMEEYEGKRFAKENENLFRLFMKTASIRALSSPFIEFLGHVGVAAIVLYGGYQVILGNSTPGTFFSFMTALILLYEPVKRLSNVNNTVQQGIAAAARVFEILDTEPEIVDRPGAVELPPMKESIEIRNVDFSYGDDPAVLKNIDLTIRAGEIVAFVGMSGVGKSTLMNLIPRFHDVTKGSITIDGTDIRDVTVRSLRDQIGIVTQQVILFNDTVRNNIAYGNIAKTEQEIIRAAKAARAHQFIMKLPQGYDTIIGEQGVRLSGGERQRISIARSILKNAPILILDEATSSLDTDSEKEVQAALENLMKGRTTLVVAHRLSTISNADRIVVLYDGTIVEEGTHNQLIKKRGEYHRLFTLQFENNGTVLSARQGTANPS